MAHKYKIGFLGLFIFGMYQTRQILKLKTNLTSPNLLRFKPCET
jgi:hypothetical protein